jgi:putative membrane protein
MLWEQQFASRGDAMRVRGWIYIAIAVAGFSIGGCAGGDREPPSAGVTPYRTPASVRPTVSGLSSADFVATSGSIDLFAIQSSELALQRSTSSRVREYAETLIRDHKGTSAQLSLAGRRLNLLPSATLEPREQAMLEQLQQSPNFDETYVHLQRETQQRALALYQSFAARGDSPTLRPVAQADIPIIERHLRLLAYL